MKVIDASAELKAKFKHLPKGMVLDHEVIVEQVPFDPDDVKGEIVRTWMQLSRFQEFFEKIESHYLRSWVDQRSIFFMLFVPMFDKKAHIANAEELNYRLRNFGGRLGLCAKEAKPKMLMSVMHKGGREQHGAVFEVEFHEEKDCPF